MTQVTSSLLEPAIALHEQVSRTNLSEVWRGVRREDGAEVAVKFALSPEAAAALEPEASTAQFLAAAGVRGIVPAAYCASPIPHLVMPWKGSRTFRDVLGEIRGGDGRARAMRTLLQAVAIVASVQQRGVLHGDLKPENILIDDRGRPWLTDFGMSRAIHQARLDSRVSRSMDKEGEGWGGTLHYLPPEGLQGEPPALSWDVYAAGVMLHEVLLGCRPDRAATPEALRATLPGAIVDLLLGALAYAPADRIETVYHLDQLIGPMRSDLTSTGPSRWARRLGRRALGGLAAFFVAFRYAAVLALFGMYAFIVFAAVTKKEPLIFVALLPFLGLHVIIRWEGPESSEEARLRQAGQVFWRR